jgi:hypothetical protein
VLLDEHKRVWPLANDHGPSLAAWQLSARRLRRLVS